ncbi:MAG: carboxypeptidase-like regulatory domain-containing protein [Pirellulaceae bacterium]|nr:carboxypeptidase-like regulatory domain-containing protein [Pirellulaceae bacterium]
MRPYQSKNPWMVFLVILSVTTSFQPAWANEPIPTEETRTKNKVASSIQDVSLGPNKVLQGTVLGTNGNPCPHCELTIFQADGVSLNTTTDERGAFAVKLPRGGVYRISSQEGSAWYRAWLSQTAPPGAATNAILIQGKETFRGQWTPTQALVTHPHFVFGMAALLVAIPVLVHNNRADREQGSSS